MDRIILEGFYEEKKEICLLIISCAYNNRKMFLTCLYFDVLYDGKINNKFKNTKYRSTNSEIIG